MRENSLLYYLYYDLERLEKPSFKSFLKWYFIPRGHCFRWNVWFRIVQCIKNGGVKKILIIPTYLMYRHYEYKYGIHVNTNIDVGKGLFIVHGDGVYINAKSVGENFTCYQGVTVGLGNNGIPEIKDNVIIYTNAVVVNDIILYDGCIIGACSFVNKSVNEKSVVIGIPAK